MEAINSKWNLSIHVVMKRSLKKDWIYRCQLFLQNPFLQKHLFLENITLPSNENNKNSS